MLSVRRIILTAALATGCGSTVGSSAGAGDAGQLDGGQLDGGQLDGGQLDGGRLDAGALDAGNDARDVTANAAPSSVACFRDALGMLVCADPNDALIPPLNTVQLDATASSDSENQPLTFAWRIASAPAGAGTTIDDPTSATPTLSPAVAGDWRVCVTATDSLGIAGAEACVTIHVVPTSRVYIELTWDHGSDLDVHLIRDSIANVFDDGSGDRGGDADCQLALDCFWVCPTPAWGAKLVLDDTDGFGPETVSFDEPQDGVYVLAGHGFWGGDADAMMRVYIEGALVATYTHTLQKEQLWEAARLTWANDAVPPWTLTAVDAVTPVPGL